MRYKEYRIAKRDGQIIQQSRWIHTTTKQTAWWKPWEYTVDYQYFDWFDEPIIELYTFRVGDRVEVLQTAGFHKGAVGEVQFVEPRGKVWVLRDNSGSPVYYDSDELKVIWRRPSQL